MGDARGKRIVLWLLGVAGLALVWFLFAGKFDEQEVVVGSLSLLVTVVLLLIIAQRHLASFVPEARHLAPLAKIPYLILKDAVTVIGALPRAASSTPVGKFSTAPFDPGGDDPESSARRALAVGATSASPNSVILGIDRDRAVLHYHELVPTGSTPEPAKSLGAE